MTLETIKLAVIEAQPIAKRFARGWHCLGLVADYQDGAPHALNIFGTRLVAYQGEDGQMHILNGYCPHMGADLSRGTVRGNSVVCPFHHWNWDGDGKCTEIPYCKRIPPKARIKSWPTCEQNQLLFVWNDPEGNPPPPEEAIPRIDASYSDEWSDWMIETLVVNSNCRELVDNMADWAHFGPVHGNPVNYWSNIFEGHVARQIAHCTSDDLGEGGALIADSAYYGPAYHVTGMTGKMAGHTVDSVLLNCHVPIDQGSFELRFGVLVKKQPSLTDAQNRENAQIYFKQVRDSFFQDVDIWAHKTRVDNPLLCEADGPVYQLRRWYEQFYTDVAGVPAALKERKVFEYDLATSQ